MGSWHPRKSLPDRVKWREKRRVRNQPLQRRCINVLTWRALPRQSPPGPTQRGGLTQFSYRKGRCTSSLEFKWNYLRINTEGPFQITLCFVCKTCETRCRVVRTGEVVGLRLGVVKTVSRHSGWDDRREEWLRSGDQMRWGRFDRGNDGRLVGGVRTGTWPTRETDLTRRV